MANANRYTGKDLAVLFVHSGGTANLSGDLRSLTVSREQETADSTAAEDPARVYKNTVKKFGAQLKAMFTGTAGSAVFAAATLGAEGTLLYAPLGTTAGRPKGGFPAIIKTQPVTIPYDNMIEVDIDFQGNGAELFNPLVNVW